MPWDHHAVGSPTVCKWAWPETKLSQNTALLLCCVSPHSRAPTHPTPRSELCKVSLQVGQLSLLPAATLRACRTRGTRARAPPAEAPPPPPPPTYLPSMPCRHLTRGPTYLPPRLIARVDLPSMNKNETQGKNERFARSAFKALALALAERARGQHTKTQVAMGRPGVTR